jgi:hypothetical protein
MTLAAARDSALMDAQLGARYGVVIRDTAPSTAKRPQSLGQAAAFALRRVTAWTTANGLTLHPDKTRMGDAREPGQGFEFLGYRFEAGVDTCARRACKRSRTKCAPRRDALGATVWIGS